MKKTIYFLTLAILLVATSGCIEWPRINDKFTGEAIPVTAEQIAGRTFAQQPYGGTSWGDELWEQIYFSPDGEIRCGLGALGSPKTSHFGRYTCDGSERIKVDGLKVFDHMSGTTWNIVAAELAITKAGNTVLYLGYDNGSGLAWDVALIYPEVGVSPVVQPWSEEPTTVIQ